MGAKSFFVANALFALILCFAVFGAVEDFSYSNAYTDFQACACSYFAIPADVINTGDVPSTYYLTIKGTAKSFTTLLPSEFSTVEKYDSSKLYYNFNIPCDAAGKYQLQTDVKTALGSYKSYSMNIDVQKCVFFEATAVTNNLKVCDGKNASYTIIVSNPLNVNETIGARINGNMASKASFDTDALFLLLPNSTGYVTLRVSTVGLDSGIYKFNASFIDMNSGSKNDVPLILNIDDNCAKATKLISFDKFLSDISKSLKFTGKTKSSGISSNLIKTMLVISSILLLLIFILLVILVIVKIKSAHEHNKKLDEWIEVPLPKKVKKVEIVLKSEKKVSEKPKKVKAEKKLVAEKESKKLDTKWITILILLLLGLLLLAGIGFAVYKNSDWILTKLSGKESGMNQSVNLSTKPITGSNVELKNLSEIKSNISDNKNKTGFLAIVVKFLMAKSESNATLENVSRQPTILDKLLGKKYVYENAGTNNSIIITNASKNTTGNVANNVSNNITYLPNTSLNATNGTFETLPYGFNPSSIFVDKFSNGCSIAIAIALLLFILSLFSLTISNEPKKKHISILKYGIPMFMFFILTFLVIYCYVGNSCPISINCTNLNGSISSSNQTITNVTNISLQAEAIECNCKTFTLLGLPIWLFALIAALIIVLFLIFLIYFMGRNNEKTIEDDGFFKSETPKPEKKVKQKKKEQSKPKAKDEAVNIWKDLILLILLLALLTSIGYLFYTHNPFKVNNYENASYSLEELTLCLMPTNQKELSCPISDVIIVDGNDIQCNLITAENKIPEQIRIGENETTLVNFTNLDIKYNWIIKRGENLLRTGFESNNTLSNTRYKEKDIVVCEISLNASGTIWNANTSAYHIKISSENDNNVTDALNNFNEKDNVNTAVNNTQKSDEDQHVKEIVNLISYIKENNLTNTFHDVVVEEGDSISLDLNSFFVDPDNDSLVFTVESITSDNISIEIWKGNATIKSAPGFIGIVNATITATDPSGEAVSGVMTIISGPKTSENNSNALNFVKDYLLYIIIGIVVLGLILLALMLLDKHSAKDNK